MRHLPRHLLKTLADHLTAELTALGWVDEPRVFGAAPVRVLSIDPEDVATAQQEPNLISVWLDDQGPLLTQQLGGGLRSSMLAVDVHLWAENPSIATALASDVADVLRNLVMPVTDYAQTPPAPSTVQLEIEEDDVAIHRPVGSVTAADFKRNWRIVTTTTSVHLSE